MTCKITCTTVYGVCREASSTSLFVYSLERPRVLSHGNPTNHFWADWTPSRNMGLDMALEWMFRVVVVVVLKIKNNLKRSRAVKEPCPVL